MCARSKKITTKQNTSKLAINTTNSIIYPMSKVGRKVVLLLFLCSWKVDQNMFYSTMSWSISN